MPGEVRVPLAGAASLGLASVGTVEGFDRGEVGRVCAVASLLEPLGEVALLSGVETPALLGDVTIPEDSVDGLGDIMEPEDSVLGVVVPEETDAARL